MTISWPRRAAPCQTTREVFFARAKPEFQTTTTRARLAFWRGVTTSRTFCLVVPVNFCWFKPLAGHAAAPEFLVRLFRCSAGESGFRSGVAVALAAASVAAASVVAKDCWDAVFEVFSALESRPEISLCAPARAPGAGAAEAVGAAEAADEAEAASAPRAGRAVPFCIVEDASPVDADDCGVAARPACASWPATRLR